MTKIVCISDTHSQNLITKWNWPEGDILVHAGDMTARGSIESIKKVGRELLSLPYRYKVVVSGNHDRFEADSANIWKLLPGIILLQDETINLMGLSIHGVAWLRYKPGVFPSRLINADEAMALIPFKADILLSHVPPYMIMDSSHTPWDERHLGSTLLLQRLNYMKPRLHVFGHAHAEYGILKTKHTTFINASLVNQENKPANDPIVIEL